MKKLIVSILFFSLLSSTSTFAQQIDDLTIDKEVLIFLKKYFKDLRNFTLETKVQEPENQVYLDSIEFSNWFTGDFNDDGLTDLFVTGMERKIYTSYIVLAADDDESFTLVHVIPPTDVGNFHVVVTEDYKTKPLVIYKQFTSEVKETVKNGMPQRIPKNYNDYYKLGFIRKDTIVYKSGFMIEFNPKPLTADIDFIQIHPYCQFGGCPDYRIKIDSAGNMIHHNISKSSDDQKVYKAKADPDLLPEFFNLVKYLKFPKKEMKYGSAEANEIITFQVKYKDGTEYKIVDYAKGGTLGLAAVYDLFFKIKDAGLWE